MKLEYPLNEALPNTDNARDRLLAKIFRFRQEEKDATGVTDQDFELLYAYGKSITVFRNGTLCLCLPFSSSGHRPTLKRNNRRGQGNREALRCPR